MKTITIGTAKNELSALLRLVRRGETILILNRRRPVARLEPVTPTSDEDRIAELERQGILKRATRPLPAYLWKTPPVKPASGTSVLAALLEERREGR